MTKPLSRKNHWGLKILFDKCEDRQKDPDVDKIDKDFDKKETEKRQS